MKPRSEIRWRSGNPDRGVTRGIALSLLGSLAGVFPGVACGESPPSDPADRAFAAEAFGIDFWTARPEIWRGVLDDMDRDRVPMGLAGFAFGWEHVEPTEPKSGRHRYDWSRIDPVFQVAQEMGRVVDLNLLCRSDWATSRLLRDIPLQDRCCAMSPPRTESDWDSWARFVKEVVERYDGDGFEDAPGIRSPRIRYLQLGDEPEVPSHFSDHGGTPKLYSRLLNATYAAAKAADPGILVVRGKTNPGNAFDDDPPPSAVRSRRPGYLEFLSATLADGNFDLVAINFNDDYTGLRPFSAWLSEEMNRLGRRRPLMVADARTTPFPRDNDSEVHVLPPRFPRGFLEVLRDSSSPEHPSTKRGYLADEARQCVLKLVISAACGMEAISLQPALMTDAPPTELWREAGLFDYSSSVTTADWRIAREPAFHAVDQTLDLLVGASRRVESFDLGPNVFAFRVTKRGTRTMVLWHEDTLRTDLDGLIARTQAIEVDLRGVLSTRRVRVRPFVGETDERGGLAIHPDLILPVEHVEIGTWPVMVFEERDR